MFLVGGPAYSGTTLLALMLNQPGVICLNEPDFHDPKQSHNGIPVLQDRYPDVVFPPRGDESLDWQEAFELMNRCQHSIFPDLLGVKFCNRPFIEFARRFACARLPVVAIVRDVRDALARPLLPYVGGEEGLVQRYRAIWRNRELFDGIVRYEDLVTNPDRVIGVVAQIVGCPLAARKRWIPGEVSESMMYPRYRHYLLKAGRLSTSRVGIWRDSGKRLTPEAHALAAEMGYE